MNTMFVFMIYIMEAILLAVSFKKDKKKSLLAIKRAKTMFITVLPQFIAIQLLVGLLLTLLPPHTIQSLIGTESGFNGMLISSIIGSISLVPVLIAFPIAAELLKNGAGIAQISVFISTLTMVGFVTLPMETKYLGKKLALLRNILIYFFSFILAYIIGVALT